jgi:hypothetical protein
VQSSLQEIITAQKIQAAYANSQTPFQTSSPCPSPFLATTSSGSVSQGQGQGQGQGHSNKTLSTSSSSFFATASHFVTPALPHYTSSSSRSREILGDKGTIQGSFLASGSGSGIGVQGSAQTGFGLGPILNSGSGSGSGVLIGFSNPGLDEDQKSDNTAPAGYMVVESCASENGTSFSDFLLPHPETMRYVH